MKYLCLVYREETKVDAMSRSEFAAFVAEHRAYGEVLRQSGHGIAAEGLQPIRTATTVWMRNGKVTTTDGPFAETKEQLGGFFLIDAPDLDEAIRMASKIPAARLGSIEIRPVRSRRCLEHPARLDEQQLDLPFRVRLVLDPLGNDEHLPRRHMDRAVAKVDPQLAVDHDERLIRILVVMPNEIAPQLHDLELIVVHPGDDLRPPLLVEQCELTSLPPTHVLRTRKTTKAYQKRPVLSNGLAS